jgi:hypothetical protein
VSRLAPGRHARIDRLARFALLACALVQLVAFGSQWWNVVARERMPCAGCKLDFLGLYTGASLLWTERPALYDLDAQRAFQLHVQPDPGGWVLPFLNPPLVALLLAPLGALSFRGAYLAMSALNLLLLAASLHVLVRGLSLSRAQARDLLLFTFANQGTHVAFLQGQTSFALLLALAAFFVAWKRRSEWRAGVWTGLLSIKPQITASLLLAAQVPPRWPLLLASGLSFAVVALSSLLIVGVDGMYDYVSLLERAVRGDPALELDASRMHNLRALGIALAPPPWSAWLWAIGSVAVLAVLYVRAARRNVDDDARFARSGYLIGIALVLLSPHLYAHDLILLGVPVAFLLKLRTASASAIVLGIALLTLAAASSPAWVPLGLLALLTLPHARPSS